MEESVILKQLNILKTKAHKMEETFQTPKRKSKVSFGKVFLVLILLALVAGISALGYLYYQTRQELKFLSSPEGQQQLAQQETSQIVAMVAKHIELPNGEPVIATITDATALAAQSAFYKNAQNGDKLLVFQEAKQAFIYSPSKNKLVNVGPILVDGSPVGKDTSGAIKPIEETIPTVIPKPSPTTQPTSSESNPESDSN